MSDDRANAAYENPVPRAVRRQVEAAEQTARELGVANTPGLDEYLAEQKQQEGEGGEGGAATPPTVGEPGGAAPSVQDPPSGSDAAAGWEQRYRTLQGKYDSEISSLRGQISGLQNVLASIQAAPAPAPAAPAQPLPPPAPVVSSEDRETWGDELPAAVSRWAGGAMGDRFDRLEGEIQRLHQENEQLRVHAGQTATTLTQQQVMAAMDRDPELGEVWRQLNEDAQFHAWLNQVDPFSGQFRLKLLREAYAQGDVARTGQFFRSYLTGHTAPSGVVVPAHTGANGTGTNGNGAGNGASAGRVNLSSLVAPGRTTVTGTDNRGAQPEKRIWSNREIGAFYRDVTRGVYRGRDADKLALEQDIFAASREGRVSQ